MTQRDVWVRWEGEHIIECALRPSDEGAWSKYVPESDVLPLHAELDAKDREIERLRAWHAEAYSLLSQVPGLISSMKSELAEVRASLEDAARSRDSALRGLTEANAKIGAKARKLEEYQKDEAGLCSELADARKEVEWTKRQLENVQTAWATEKARADAADTALRMVSIGVYNVWRWQGDGGDHPESLSCPVVMSADTLRSFVKAKEDRGALLEVLGECQVVVDQVTATKGPTDEHR